MADQESEALPSSKIQNSKFKISIPPTKTNMSLTTPFPAGRHEAAMPAPAPLPAMSAQEASWHEHLAGMRAADAARAQGADPAAIAAFAAATAGPVTIAGRVLEQASQGTIWTLQRIAREFTDWADAKGLPVSPDPDKSPGTRELIELGIATLVFIDSRTIWTALDEGRAQEIYRQAENMMWEIPLAEQLVLQRHFRAEMDRIRVISGDDAPAPEKKTAPPVQPGVSSAMPIQPPAPASPPSNGSPPSTGSPSLMPCGAPPSP